MSILHSIPKSKLGFKGQQPPLFGETASSTLHYTSSLNNNPAIKKRSSFLDLDGKTPSQYINNLPR